MGLPNMNIISLNLVIRIKRFNGTQFSRPGLKCSHYNYFDVDSLLRFESILTTSKVKYYNFSPQLMNSTFSCARKTHQKETVAHQGYR